MLPIAALVLAGGTLYAGLRTYPQWRTKTRAWLSKRMDSPATMQRPKITVAPPANNPDAPTTTLALPALSLGLATAGLVVQPLFGFASTGLVVYLALPRLRAAYQALRQRQGITPAVLDATRISVCVVLGFGLVAAVDVYLYALSQRWLQRERQKFEAEITQLFAKTQPTSWVFRQGVEVATPTTQVAVGDIVVLTAGELLPFDGSVVYGEAWVNQIALTGDPQPVYKGVGDPVPAASVVVAGELYVLTRTEVAQPRTANLRAAFQQGVASPTVLQQVGEANGKRMAPWMLGLFGLSLPWLGANHAAAFLTTSSGAYMSSLAPLARQQVIPFAARHGVVIKNSRVLERLNMVNTIILDQRLLRDPTVYRQAKALIAQLRQRAWPLQPLFKQPFAIYLLGVDQVEETQQMALDLGCDDYLLAASGAEPVLLLENLQLGGRFVCYLGNGVTDGSVMEKTWASISMGSADTLASDQGQIVLLGSDLTRLPGLFDLAARYTAKEGFSLLAPIVIDMVDIGTTLLLHFGLIYAIFFSYGGLFLSMANLNTLIKPASQEATAKSANAMGLLEVTGHPPIDRAGDC